MVLVWSLGLQLCKIMIKYTCSASLLVACLLRTSAVSLCGGQEDTSSCECLCVLSDHSAHVEVLLFLLPLACSVLEKVRLWQLTPLARGYLQPPGRDY